MLKDTIKEYEEHRIHEGEYLSRVENIMDKVVSHQDEGFPEEVSNNDVAKAIFGISKELIINQNLSAEITKDVCVLISLQTDNIFKNLRIVDWQENPDIIKKMKMQIFDMIYDEAKTKYNLDISITDIDLFTEKCI